MAELELMPKSEPTWPLQQDFADAVEQQHVLMPGCVGLLLQLPNTFKRGVALAIAAQTKNTLKKAKM